MKAVLAIPAYNCARQLDRVLESIDSKLADRFTDILVIDNISPDDTVQVALSYKTKIKNLHVLRNKNNYSLGGSHKVAFLYAERVGATHVAVLHGDDQAVAQELHQLLDEAEKQPKADAVLGTRFMKGSHLQGYDWKRIAGNRVLNLTYTLISFRKTRDLGSGLNVFKLEIFKNHTYLQFADKLTFNIELLLYLYSYHAKIIYYPITWRETDQVSNARNFTIAKIAFQNLMSWRFGKLKYQSSKVPTDYESEELN